MAENCLKFRRAFCTRLNEWVEMLSVLHYVGVFVIVPFLTIIAFVVILFSRYWWTLVIYACWFYIDFDTPKRGSRPKKWFRNLRVWHKIRDYFPISLEKTCEFTPDRNYLIGYHPHGILAFGAFINFATEVTGFDCLFPGIKPHPVTLRGQFWFPLRRDYIMLSGGCECSADSINYILRSGSGHAVVLVIGGAEEALNAHPGQHILNLRKRFGFIRLALKSGSLVPAYSFGESDAYCQVPNVVGALLRNFQSGVKRFFGITGPAFSGTGLLNSAFGILPRRVPITTVVGKPIHVDQPVADPSDEILRHYHDLYEAELVAVFEKNKARFGIGKETHLIID